MHVQLGQRKYKRTKNPTSTSEERRAKAERGEQKQVGSRSGYLARPSAHSTQRPASGLTAGPPPLPANKRARESVACLAPPAPAAAGAPGKPGLGFPVLPHQFASIKEFSSPGTGTG